jgi:hypothetical protein
MRYAIALLVMGLGACSQASPESEPSELASTAQALSVQDFDVDFEDCNVFAGLAHVSGARARALVPPAYALALDGDQARMVVRVVHCSNVVVDGRSQGSTVISHIGVGLVGPDTTVSLNNFTLWYATNSPLLHAKLTAAGVNADQSGFLAVGVQGALTVSSQSPHTPSFEVSGSVMPPGAPVPTSASWWDDGVHGAVRSRTVLPVIQFGVAHTSLSTPPDSALAELIGGPTLTFDILDSYNVFPTGHMEVRASD